MTRSAIMSIAVSRSRCSQLADPGRRYLTRVSRYFELTYCSEAAPFGHSRPRLIGESGSPSIWTTFSSLTNTRCAQPTAQYGQTDFTTLSAVAVRLTTCSVALLRAATPRPSGSEPVSCRNTGHASSHVFTPGSLPLGRATRPLTCAGPVDDGRACRGRPPAHRPHTAASTTPPRRPRAGLTWRSRP